MLIDSTKIVSVSREGAPARLKAALGLIEDVCTIGEARVWLESGGFTSVGALNAIGECVAAGCMKIEWSPRSEALRILATGGQEAEELCRREPQWWNAAAYEREWDTYPEYNDFLDPASPVYHRKKYQWEVYDDLLKSELGGLAPGARFLDAGGGIGRASLPLAKRGCAVTLVDASPRALCAAWGHLARAGAEGYDLAWGEASRLDFIEDGSMDAALSLEVLCYVPRPEEALKEIARCVRPGGWVAYSMENGPGAAIADRHLTFEARLRAIVHGEAQVEGDLHVRYFTDAELEDMSRDAGLKDVRIMNCHYFADGLLDAFTRERDYSSPAALRRMAVAERAAGKMPLVCKLGRATLIVGRKLGARP